MSVVDKVPLYMYYGLMTYPTPQAYEGAPSFIVVTFAVLAFLHLLIATVLYFMVGAAHYTIVVGYLVGAFSSWTWRLVKRLKGAKQVRHA